MTYHDYRVSQQLEIADAPFYSLVMAAMRRADSGNLQLLRMVFPEVWEELQTRYNAPGGRLPSDETPTFTPTREGGQ